MEDRAVKVTRVDRSLDLSAITLELKIRLIPKRKKIMRDLVAIVSKFIPYRNIDTRMYQALLLHEQGMSFTEASMLVFQTKKKADQIRHWYNRLKEMGYE